MWVRCWRHATTGDECSPPLERGLDADPDVKQDELMADAVDGRVVTISAVPQWGGGLSLHQSVCVWVRARVCVSVCHRYRS